MAIELESEERGPDARDAFWCLALQEPRGTMHPEEVRVASEDRRSWGFLQDPDRLVRPPEASFSITGRLLELVRPLSPAEASIGEIRRLLVPPPRSPSTAATAATSPSVASASAMPAMTPTGSVGPLGDGMTQFGLLELD